MVLGLSGSTLQVHAGRYGVRHDDAVPLDPTPRPPMVPPAQAPRALLTVNGADRPGVTARLFSALAAGHGAPAVEVLDVEQVVVHGHLVLGVVVGALADGDGPTADETALLGFLSTVASDVSVALGVSVDFESASEPQPEPSAGRPHHVIVLGRPVPPGAVAGAARAIAGIGGNIDAIR